MRKDRSEWLNAPSVTGLSVVLIILAASGVASLAQTADAYVRLNVSTTVQNELWVDVEIKRDEGLALENLGSAVVDLLYTDAEMVYTLSIPGDLGDLLSGTSSFFEEQGGYVRQQVVAAPFVDIPVVPVGTQWQRLVQHRFAASPSAGPKDFSIRTWSLHLGFVENFEAKIVRSVDVQVEPTVENGQKIESAISEPGAEIPFDLALGENYPNPFAAVSHVSFALRRQVNVRLSVYDMLGREVSVLVNQVLGPGIHAATIDATNLRPGVYLLAMEAGAFRATTKITVSR